MEISSPVQAEKQYAIASETGLYNKAAAQKISYRSDKLTMDIFILQINENQFIASKEFSFKTGNRRSTVDSLTRENKIFSNKDLAIGFCIGYLIDAMKKIKQSYGSLSQLNEAKEAIKWLESSAPYQEEIKLEVLLPLNEQEKQKLKVLQNTINKGLETFFEVGAALLEIKEKKLYRDEFKTFDEYCKEKHNITDRYARNLIASSEVIENLKNGTIVPDILPATESQARELLKAPKNLQSEAWDKVKKKSIDTGEKITAKFVEDVVKDYLPKIQQAPDQLPGQTSFIPESIEITQKKEETEIIILPAQERTIIELPVRIENQIKLSRSIIDCALSALKTHQADFAIQDERTGDFIPAKNQTNESISFFGKGICNLIAQYQNDLRNYGLEIIEKIRLKNILEVIIFLKADFNDDWFKIFSEESQAMCTLAMSSPYPIVAFYFGDSPASFSKQFYRSGKVWELFNAKPNW